MAEFCFVDAYWLRLGGARKDTGAVTYRVAVGTWDLDIKQHSAMEHIEPLKYCRAFCMLYRAANWRLVVFSLGARTRIVLVVRTADYGQFN